MARLGRWVYATKLDLSLSLERLEDVRCIRKFVAEIGVQPWVPAFGVSGFPGPKSRGTSRHKMGLIY